MKCAGPNTNGRDIQHASRDKCGPDVGRLRMYQQVHSCSAASVCGSEVEEEIHL